jgi:demethylmenaquinone methyltransferase/2-methoxy-6-polyprenyl-1,4-benzoquinol methylase
MTRTTATKIVGLDISAGMLEVGVKKLPKRMSNTIEMVSRFRKHAFEDNYFDAITVAFGVGISKHLTKD